jgi:hypothetical protein
VENGSIRDLVDEFLGRVKNRRIPKGSIVLLFTASHLADVGLAMYTEDLLAARKMIKEKTGMGTLVSPLPPMLLGGCSDPALLRSIYELTVWAHDFFEGEEAFMEDSMISSLAIIQQLGMEKKTSWESRRIALPCSKSNTGIQIWNSGGEDCRAMPCLVKPLTPALEKKLVCTLIEELRAKLALDLEPMPSFDRRVGSQSSAKKKVEFLMVGSSNAKRTARALEDMGHNTHLVFAKNWRITRDNVETLAARISAAISDTDPETVVLQLLDGSCFFAKGEDGSRTLPRRHSDGNFHIEGELVVCPSETQAEHFNCMRPIWDAVGKRLCIVISPMPRYIIEGCCSNPLHVTNREDRHFKSDMMTQLEGLKRGLKNYFFNTRRRNFRISDMI